MPEKKCPMCDGECVLKILAAGAGDGAEVDVCSVCGAKFPREETGKPRKDEDG